MDLRDLFSDPFDRIRKSNAILSSKPSPSLTSGTQYCSTRTEEYLTERHSGSLALELNSSRSTIDHDKPPRKPQKQASTIMERLLDPSAVRGHVVPNMTELNEEALMLLTAGNDTTANAMIFGIYYICRHLDVQQELASELRAQFPDPEQRITYEELKNLPYLVRESPPPHSIRSGPSLSLEPKLGTQ